MNINSIFLVLKTGLNKIIKDYYFRSFDSGYSEIYELNSSGDSSFYFRSSDSGYSEIYEFNSSGDSSFYFRSSDSGYSEIYEFNSSGDSSFKQNLDLNFQVVVEEYNIEFYITIVVTIDCFLVK